MNIVINKIIKFIDKSINAIVVILLLLVMCLAGYALYDSYFVFNGARLSDDIRRLGPDEGEFSLEKLQEINPDICAWIKINDTNINYPIVIGVDNTEYLSLDYKKQFSVSGCIFLDYRNDRDFNDNYSVVYGHNLEAGVMFSGLKDFADNQYFNEHPSGKLYTTSGIYNIDIYSFNKVNAFSHEAYGLAEFKNGKMMQLIDFYGRNAVNRRQLEFNPDDKLILLSTCDAAGTNDRSVLFGKLTKTDGDDTIGNSNTLKKIDKEADDTKSAQAGGEAPSQTTIKVNKIYISKRDLALIIMSLIVIVIFGILAVQNINKSRKRKEKSKGSTSRSDETKDSKKRHKGKH